MAKTGETARRAVLLPEEVHRACMLMATLCVSTEVPVKREAGRQNLEAADHRNRRVQASPARSRRNISFQEARRNRAKATA